MEDQQFLIHAYLTAFAPEMVAIGLNALVYAVMTRSDKLQHSALLRRDVTLNVVIGGLVAIFFRIIANFSREYLNLHYVTCTGMAYLSQVSVGVLRCAVLLAAYHRYSSVGGVKFGLGDLARKDLTLLIWIAPVILECPALLSFGIQDGMCGFLHEHLAMMYIGLLTVMAIIPIFLYGIILQLTLSALPEHVALSEEQMILKRSTKIIRGVLVGGILMFLPVQLWDLVIDNFVISVIACLFISHVLLTVICVAEMICFAFMDPVFQLEYRKFSPNSEKEGPRAMETSSRELWVPGPDGHDQVRSEARAAVSDQ